MKSRTTSDGAGEGINKKISRLKGEVDWFYSDKFDLDAALGKYRGALSLAREIEKDLSDMKNEIRVIDRDFSRES